MSGHVEGKRKQRDCDKVFGLSKCFMDLTVNVL
jgi:hypothetical protein